MNERQRETDDMKQQTVPGETKEWHRSEKDGNTGEKTMDGLDYIAAMRGANNVTPPSAFRLHFFPACSFAFALFV